MKGYKMFNNDWTCQGFQFEVGKTYEIEGEIELCSRGFHFCTKIEDCFNYYDAVTWNKVAEIEALGEVKKAHDDSKCVTSKIKIVKEISFEELKTVNRSTVLISLTVLIGLTVLMGLTVLIGLTVLMGLTVLIGLTAY